MFRVQKIIRLDFHSGLKLGNVNLRPCQVGFDFLRQNAENRYSKNKEPAFVQIYCFLPH